MFEPSEHEDLKMHIRICPNEYVALRLPSDVLKIEEIVPNTYV